MATMAPRRSAWSLPARAAGSARVLAPIALGGIVAIAIFLRTRDFDVGYWIDEGLSVGIADRPLGDIPGVLRLDGSPPLYYSLLHFWIGLVGRSESATHALSLIFAVLAVPAAWWAVRGIFGARAGWMAALLVGDQPVPDPVRAGDAHVRARDAARNPRVRHVPPRPRAGRKRGRDRAGSAPLVGGGVRARADGDALHPQLVAVLRRRLRGRMARPAGDGAAGGLAATSSSTA
jgi:hypothetical protein